MRIKLCLLLVLLATQINAKRRKQNKGHYGQRIDKTTCEMGSKDCYLECDTQLIYAGIDYSMMGYNILYGFPMENGMDPGFRQPLFNKTFDHKMYTPDCLYMVPFGFDAEPAVSCVTTFSADEVKNKEDIEHVFSNEVSTEEKFFGFHFSASNSYQKKTADMSEHESVYIYSSAICTYYLARLDPVIPPPLHRSFVAFLEQLNNTDNPYKYFQLFDEFGTHYIQEAFVGARYAHEYHLTKDQYAHVSESSVGVTVQAGFASMFELGDELSTENKQTAMGFLSNSTSSTITVGATPEPNADPNAWASTVKKYPVPMKLVLGSIEDIFESQFFVGLDVNFPKIKNNIHKYLPQYCKFVENGTHLKNICNSSEEDTQDLRSEQLPVTETFIQDCPAQATFSGINFIMMGYNIFYGYPMQQGLDPGFKHPIFNITFEQHSFTPDCMYKVPDGLQIVMALSCVTSFSAEEATTEHDFSKTLSNTVSTGTKFFGAHFSASTGYRKNVNDMQNSHTSFVYSSANCDYYFTRLDKYFPPRFTNSFVLSLKNLENDTSSKENFFEFFNLYGTHYLKESYSGARYSHEYRLTEEEYKHAEESSLSVSAQAKYSSIFSLSGGDKLTDEQRQAAEDFASHSTSTTVTVGALPQQGGDPNAWASVVQDTPLPMKMVLGSIDELFEKEFFTGLDIDYEALKTAAQIYLPEYCRYIEKTQGIQYVCKSAETYCGMDLYGPHDPNCLWLWWYMTGCSPDGSAAPNHNDTNVQRWNAMDSRSVFLDMVTYKIRADKTQTQHDYTRCYWDSEGCTFYQSRPYGRSCLYAWFTNAGCNDYGADCPVHWAAARKWEAIGDPREVRAKMIEERSQTDAGDVNAFQKCFAEDTEGCRMEGKGPFTTECLTKWWTAEGCDKYAIGSPDNSPANVKRWNSMTAVAAWRDMHAIHLQALSDNPVGSYEICFSLYN